MSIQPLNVAWKEKTRVRISELASIELRGALVRTDEFRQQLPTRSKHHAPALRPGPHMAMWSGKGLVQGWRRRGGWLSSHPKEAVEWVKKFLEVG